MLSFITEKKSCWELLQNENRPIYIYGMGNGTEKILDVFKKYNIKTKGIFASDEFVRGHFFRDFKVKKYSEVTEEEDDFVIVLAFAAGYQSLIEKIENMANEHTLYAPDVPIEGGGLFDYDYCLQHSDEIEAVYNMLEDELSKKVYAGIINFKISGKIQYLAPVTTNKTEVYNNIIRPLSDEIYVDLGAYNGDTVRELLDYTGGKYEKIYAMEPDCKNYKKLISSVDGMENIVCYNCAVWSCDTGLHFSSKAGRQSSVKADGEEKEARSVDSILSGGRATIIKMDVEGAEEEAISGAAHTIRTYKPRLMISLYHRNRDMFFIPLMIKKLNPDYRLFIRHQPYIPAWETNLYAI